jgi:hypothetical protein
MEKIIREAVERITRIDGKWIRKCESQASLQGSHQAVVVLDAPVTVTVLAGDVDAL